MSESKYDTQNTVNPEKQLTDEIPVAKVIDIQNGDCTEISDILYENINAEYNSFDEGAQLQVEGVEYYNINLLNVKVKAAIIDEKNCICDIFNVKF